MKSLFKFLRILIDYCKFIEMYCVESIFLLLMLCRHNYNLLSIKICFIDNKGDDKIKKTLESLEVVNKILSLKKLEQYKCNIENNIKRVIFNGKNKERFFFTKSIYIYLGPEHSENPIYLVGILVLYSYIIKNRYSLKNHSGDDDYEAFSVLFNFLDKLIIEIEKEDDNEKLSNLLKDGCMYFKKRYKWYIDMYGEPPIDHTDRMSA